MIRRLKWVAFGIGPMCPIGLILLCLSISFASPSDRDWIHHAYAKGDFKLVDRLGAADILVASSDFKVVQIAAQNLADDVERVTGKKPAIRSDYRQASRQVVILGTLDKSPLLQSLYRSGKLRLEDLRGKWESFAITTVRNPFPNVDMALVIAGSDRRGTAYGVFELSEAIGVSPWYWWADVPPVHHANLFVAPDVKRAGPPSVKYRGIFLNDEDLGLQPWAAKTFDPQLGDIGPKTYARVFELLLRLKANTLWPAMHGCTKAFNLYPDNKRVADDYAIVMGSSHAEPMLRNNVTEWIDKPENYDYTKNREGVLKYWEERAAQNGQYENIYTIGMRGIHDSPIVGPKTQQERIEVLQNIFSDQRSLLAKHVNPNVTEVPQIFCPYKEVLADYRSGLKVPDDITIVFPDDNFGYIRYFPNAEERQRAGGFGVYYHVSYLGGPLSYLWLDTTPPALIWEEMSKAYDHSVRQFWMLNVGDLKPAEISIELFLQMGWDISRWRRENLNQFLVTWAASKFGAAHAREIAALMDQYYQLGFARKPEHLQWNFANEKPKPTELTSVEVQRRLDDYDALMSRANQLYAVIPSNQRDSFYELVLYPIRGAALANRRYFGYQKSAEYLAQDRASASAWAERAAAADAQMNAETDYYNQKLAGGKWRRMMMIEPPNGQWQNMRMTKPVAPEGLAQSVGPEKASLGVEGAGSKRVVKVPVFNPRVTSTANFVAVDGVVSIEAEHFSRRIDRGGTGWQIIPGLGRTGDSVAIFPTTAASIDPARVVAKAPALEYSLQLFAPGKYNVTCYLVPTHPIQAGHGLRFAIGIDDQPPQLVTVGADLVVPSRQWSLNVLNAAAIANTSLEVKTVGPHVLKLYMIDPGVVVDKIVLDAGGAKPSYLGPLETRNRH